MREGTETRYTEGARKVVAGQRLSVMNAAPIGVPLDREKVGRLLERRKRAVGRQLTEAEEWQILNNAGCGDAPVLWNAATQVTRHLLAAGNGWQTGTLRDALLAHVREHRDLWQAVVLETEEEQVRALSLEVPARDYRTEASRKLLVVDNPESQEVLSLLTRFAWKADVMSRVNLAVLTSTPAAIPSALLRHLGFRVAFKANISDSRDMVGDDSAATLPVMENFNDAAVVYEEWLANDPEHGAHRVDLPGRRNGRRLDVYVGRPSSGAATDDTDGNEDNDGNEGSK